MKQDLHSSISQGDTRHFSSHKTPPQLASECHAANLDIINELDRRQMKPASIIRQAKIHL